MELIEREAPLAALESAAAEAAQGGGRIVLVSGEAGIGKTSLVRAFARGRANTWWGGCEALQTPAPLAPLHDMAAASVSLRALLAGPLQGSALFAAVVREIEAAGPVTIVIEDAHWADGSTLDLLRYVGRRIDRTRALLVVTYRQDEIGPAHPLRLALGELPAGATGRLELSRLSRQAVEALAREALREPAQVHALTGGNPFFVTELLRHAGEHIPASVQDLVLARLARLPASAREVVHLAAIVPARIERELVEAVLGPRLADVEACLDSGLLLADATSLRFRHELARVAVEASLSPPAARDLHVRALAGLRMRGDVPVARLVHHATHAADAEAVLAFAPRAAREARARGSRREAASHYRSALRFLPPGDGDEIALLEALACECEATNQLAEAIDARERIGAALRTRADVPGEARNLSQLALVLVLALRNREADAASRRAIALLEDLPPGRDLAWAYRVEAQLRMLNRDCRDSVAWGRKSIALAESLGDAQVLAAAHCTVGAALMFLDVEAGRQHLHRALRMALDGGLDFLAANCHVNLGSAAGELFDLRAAAADLEQAIAFATRKEIDFYRCYAYAWQALVLLFLGRWDESEAHAHEGLAGSPEGSTARVMALCALGRLRARRGDADAREPLDEALRLAQATGTLQRVAPVRIARAEAAFLAGDVEGARNEAQAALPLAHAHAHPWHVGELSLWLSRAGAPGAPLEACARPHALQLSGDWRSAAAAWQALECPYEQARALAEGDAGARLEALATFDRLGARPAADALRRALREAGVRQVPRGPRASTRRNPRGLTARELEIVALLARGLRNSEIAERLCRSVRTIEHHVDAILAKLGARSRAEVAAIARREGLLPAEMGTGAAQNA